MLTVLLKYTDLASLRAGLPAPDGFLNLTVGFLAEQTGMTRKRAERALADLQAADLVTIAQARKPRPDGSWKGLAAVKAISRHLFALFGLEKAETGTRQGQSTTQAESPAVGAEGRR